MRRSRKKLSARHQAPPSLRVRDRFSSRHTPTLGNPSQRDPEALLSSPATQTDPACHSRNPADRAVGAHEGHAASLFLSKQNQHLPEWVSVPGRWPADAGDQVRPGVSQHECGSCFTVGPGRMRRETTLVSCHGRGPCSTKLQVRPPGFDNQKRPGWILLPILTSTSEWISLKECFSEASLESPHKRVRCVPVCLHRRVEILHPWGV